MSIERKDTQTETTFIINDELLTANINMLNEELGRFVRGDTKDAIIDLAFVQKIESFSIAALIRFKNMLAERGRTMHLINPNEQVFRVLELAGLDKFLME